MRSWHRCGQCEHRLNRKHDGGEGRCRFRITSPGDDDAGNHAGDTDNHHHSGARIDEPLRRHQPARRRSRCRTSKAQRMTPAASNTR